MEAYILFLTYIITFSFLLSKVPLSHSEPADEQYSKCHSPFSCGKKELGEIGYPFWSKDVDRPSYCGSDGFELNCPNYEDDGFPSIQMNSQTFEVTQINPVSYNMTLVRTDLVYEDCPPDSTNTSLSNLFHFESNVKNVTLFYDCSQEISIGGNNFTCRDPPYSHKLAFYFEEDDGLLGQFPELYKCGRIIQVQVSQETKLNPQGDIEALKTALHNGFGVRYDVERSCRPCVESNGTCGSNDESNFTCYCPDGHPALTCFDSSSMRFFASSPIFIISSFSFITSKIYTFFLPEKLYFAILHLLLMIALIIAY